MNPKVNASNQESTPNPEQQPNQELHRLSLSQQVTILHQAVQELTQRLEQLEALNRYYLDPLTALSTSGVYYVDPGTIPNPTPPSNDESRLPERVRAIELRLQQISSTQKSILMHLETLSASYKTLSPQYPQKNAPQP